MTLALRFENVSKRFKLNIERPRSFQELFIRGGKKNKGAPAESGYFWALRNISFTVDHGESVAIVGSNGAGKSTMLKLIARIIKPTSGCIEIDGHLSALLELGAGFHPDLTGRENVYLNGAILGLDRSQIRPRLDEIIAFAELEPFIDMPVKHYSSGMFMRLGFSITVHMQPEILLVDEILAVGDQVFQQKCLDRINQLKREGVTIVLVSHALDNVWRLCERAIWLKDGQIQADGNATSVVDQYLAFSNKRYYRQRWAEHDTAIKPRAQGKENDRWGTLRAEITKVELLGANGSSPPFFETGDFFRLRIHYHAKLRIDAPTFGLAFYREDGVHINGPNSVQDGYELPYIEGPGFVDYTIEHLPLNPGNYELTVAIYNHNSTIAHDHHQRMYAFEVRSPRLWREEGLVHIPARWRHTAHAGDHSSEVEQMYVPSGR